MMPLEFDKKDDLSIKDKFFKEMIKVNSRGKLSNLLVVLSIYRVDELTNRARIFMVDSLNFCNEAIAGLSKISELSDNQPNNIIGSDVSQLFFDLITSEEKENRSRKALEYKEKFIELRDILEQMKKGQNPSVRKKEEIRIFLIGLEDKIRPTGNSRGFDFGYTQLTWY
jgi:hypothetical protein